MTTQPPLAGPGREVPPSTPPAEPVYATLEVVDAAAPGPGARIARTAQQATVGAGLAGSVVVLLFWVLRLTGLDLDPDSAGTSAPEYVVAAATAVLAGVLTVVGAWVMNRGKSS